MWEMCVVSNLLIQALFCIGSYLDVCFLIRIITPSCCMAQLSTPFASCAPLAHPSSLWGSFFWFLTPQVVWPSFAFLQESCIQTFQVAFVGN